MPVTARMCVMLAAHRAGECRMLIGTIRLVRSQALVVESDIRATGIALSEVEYIALLRCFAGQMCATRASATLLCFGLRLMHCDVPFSYDAAHRSNGGSVEAWSLLRRMKDDIRLASAELLSAIRQWFESLDAGWRVGDATIDEEGAHTADASIRLQAVCALCQYAHASSRCPGCTDDARPREQIDLTEAEREELARAIATLSRARERAQDFDG